MKRFITTTILSCLALSGTAFADNRGVGYYVTPANQDCGQHVRSQNNGSGALVGALIGGVVGGAIGNNVDGRDHYRRGYRHNSSYGRGYRGHSRRGYRGRNNSNSGEVVAGAIIGAILGGTIGRNVERSNGQSHSVGCSNWQYQDVAQPTIRPSAPVSNASGYGVQSQGNPSAGGASCQIIAETVRGPNGLVSYPVEVCRNAYGDWVKQ